MPGYNGTGPAGGGAMTGQGRGLCNPKGSYGFVRPWFGRGAGFGLGSRRGYRHMYWETGLPRWARRWTGRGGRYVEPSYSQEDEISMLKEEARRLKEDLNAIEGRISAVGG